MAQTVNRPTIFIGSSTPALSIAREISRKLSDIAEVDLWETAFDKEAWLLAGILKKAQQSDFGVFVINQDDELEIAGTKYKSVRDNVLFEAGIFMGALGPERTILLWPSGQESEPLRLPSDLAGLMRVEYKVVEGKPDRDAVERIRSRIKSMGMALRSPYNEIANLKQALYEREIEFEDDSSESLATIIQRAAKRRQRAWFSVTSVENLINTIEENYDDDTVDQVFSWLIVYGVIRFNNIYQWTDSYEWDYKSSMDHTEFTERGVVLLNELRTSPTRK